MIKKLRERLFRKGPKPYRLPLKKKLHYYFRTFRSPFNIIMFTLMVWQTFVILFSLYWMFSTALKSQVNFGIDNIGLPNPFRFDNFTKAFSYLYVQVKESGGYRDIFLPELLYNTLAYTIGMTVVIVLPHAATGYVLCKFKKFKLIRFVIMFIMMLLIIPLNASLASSIQWNQIMGVYDNLPMILFSSICCLDPSTFIYMSMFEGVSNSYIEAAKIDGASNLKIMLTIAFPLVRGILTLQLVTNFITYWNDYMNPFIYLPSMPTMAVALMKFGQSGNGAISNEPMQLAAAALVSIPCILLFICARKLMLGNFTLGGVKE